MSRISVIKSGKFQKPEKTHTTAAVPPEMCADIREPEGIKCRGTDMEPVIPSGAIIFIDKSDRELVEGDLFLFHFPVTAFPGGDADEVNPGAIQPRRVLKIQRNGVLLGVENPDCSTWFIENAAVRVWGRVKVVGAPTGKEGEYTWSRVPSARSLQ